MKKEIKKANEETKNWEALTHEWLDKPSANLFKEGATNSDKERKFKILTKLQFNIDKTLFR